MLHRSLDEEIPEVLYESREREYPHKLYIVFYNKEDKDKALSLIKDNQQFLDIFRFLNEIKYDPQQPDLGIELSFDKSPQNNTEQIINYLRENGLQIERSHFVNSDGKETRPN